jgi:hypothetical protein
MSKLLIVSMLSASLVAGCLGSAEAQTGTGTGGGTGGGTGTRSAPTTTQAPIRTAPAGVTAPTAPTAAGTTATKAAPKHDFCPPGQRGKNNKNFNCR